MSSPEPRKRRGFSLAHGRRKGGCEASEELDDGFGEKECRWPIGSERGPDWQQERETQTYNCGELASARMSLEVQNLHIRTHLGQLLDQGLLRPQTEDPT